ncbi:MAG: CPBP family intramembrane metalloprotease [Rhodoglobus sp.]|nr:CPBP family intramembrane metalloprotease [Rhodoglobus sp.]
MLDPDWSLTPILLGVALAGVLVALVARAVRKDRREYQRFKRYRTTAKRQHMFRRWLVDSLLWLGGLSLGVLLLAWSFLTPLLRELTTWPGIHEIRGFTTHEPGAVAGFTVGAVVALVVVTAFGIVAARKEQQVPTVGDIHAILPRNRQELRLGALLSINAGVVEELLFRLGMPALIFGATGSAVAAVIGSVLLFGALHAYQGVVGIVASTLIGALFMLTYALSGTIFVPILLHVLFDLRSLVLIPVAVYGVHRINGITNPITKPLGKPKAEPVTQPEPQAPAG